MRKPEKLAQQGEEFERGREMPRSPPAVADECILDILEFAEDAIEKRGDLTSGKIIDALGDKAAVEFDDLLDGAVLLVQASDAERSAEPMIAAGGQDAAKGALRSDAISTGIC